MGGGIGVRCREKAMGINTDNEQNRVGREY